MFELYHINQYDIFGFALSLIRISACLVVLPFFGGAQIPRSLKVLFSLVVTFCLFPVVRSSFVQTGIPLDNLVLLALREAVVGLFFGFLGRILFFGVSMAGQFIGFSTGLSAASLVNPSTQENTVVLEQFYYALAMLLFLGVDGHHIFLAAINKSFELIPAGRLTLNVDNMRQISILAQESLIIGIQLAGPVIGVIWFVNIALGILGRAVSQINVFVTSFPINFMLGIFVLMLSIPFTIQTLDRHFFEIGEAMFKMMKGF